MAEPKVAGTKKKMRFSLPLWQRNVRYGEVDLAFFLIVIALLVMGIVMMFSASYAWAIAEGRDGTYYAVSQIKNAVVGLVIMCVLCLIDYHFLQKKFIAVCAYVLPILLLIMVFVPGIGVTDGGATRWIAIGSFNFQPSEVMKIGIVIFFSYVIEKNYANMRSFRKGLLPLLFAMAVPAALLIKEPHLSATVLIAMTCIILIFVGGADIKQFLILGAVALGGALLIGFLMSGHYEYIGKRIASWARPVLRQPGRHLADLSVSDCHWLGRTVRSGSGRIPAEVSVSAGDEKRLRLFHCLRRAWSGGSADCGAAFCAAGHPWIPHRHARP